MLLLLRVCLLKSCGTAASERRCHGAGVSEYDLHEFYEDEGNGMGWAMTIPREANPLLCILLCPSYACMTTSLSLVPKYCPAGKAHLSYSKPVEALLKQQQIHHRFLKSTTSNFSPGPSTTCPGLSASV